MKKLLEKRLFQLYLDVMHLRTNPAPWVNRLELKVAYGEGDRDARHAAASLVMKATLDIEALVSALIEEMENSRPTSDADQAAMQVLPVSTVPS